jgi:carbamoyl-phosphate synthase small subunit
MNPQQNNFILELEDGFKVEGQSFGADIPVSGEIVFCTAVTGYTESITDPSYAGQLLVFTQPMIGNYGIPNDKTDKKDIYGISEAFESDKPYLKAVICQEYISSKQHWEASMTLGDYLIQNNIVGLSNIDTRQLTLHIREHGSCMARIYKNDSIQVDIPEFIDIGELDLVSQVSTQEITTYQPIPIQEVPKTILFFDCGTKNSQIREMVRRGLTVERVPHDYGADIEESEVAEFLKPYHAIFISNGPGDPRKNTKLIQFIRNIIKQKIDIQIFGICLGHQILGLSVGMEIIKMPFGNRGQNIPVINTYKDGNSNSIMPMITSQNHGYCLNNEGFPDNWEVLFVNANDGSNEGIKHSSLPYWGVQFHPEARGGPQDSTYLFDIFAGLYKSFKMTTCENINKTQLKKVIILGSSGLSIGQAGEFDYSTTQALKAFKEDGIETVLVNPNIATIQTSKGLSNRIYYLPITPEFVEQVIAKERPDAITFSFGGQTSLNCGIQLYDNGTLEKFNVAVLGTSIESVKISENRKEFKDILKTIGIETPPSITIDIDTSNETLEDFIKEVGYPVLVRAGFCLGGQGSGFANNIEQLRELTTKAFQISSCVIIDKSLYGWRELEYEIVRDSSGAKIAVCNMENLDPLGVHTGESIVVAPSQTLTDFEHQTLRTICFQIVDKLNIVGECNVQFAICNSHDSLNFTKTTQFDVYVIEMNARLSRSSALASKATGYPLAYIAAKLATGKLLVDLKNKITQSTSAFFEPALDYVVVKIPKWDLAKFPNVSTTIGSHMKSVGEVMAIGRTFKEALQKGVRMVGDYPNGFVPSQKDIKLAPHSSRIEDLFNYLYINSGSMTDAINYVISQTGIDYWFVSQIADIVKYYQLLEKTKGLDRHIVLQAKKYGFSDKQIARAMKTTESIVRQYRQKTQIYPSIKQIDTVAGEFPCYTNYLYLTYHGITNDVKPSNSIIVLGSGVFRIGSSVEFDWCAVSCARELKHNGK